MKKHSGIVILVAIVAAMLMGCGANKTISVEKERTPDRTESSISGVMEVDPFAYVMFPMEGNSGEAFFTGRHAWADIPTSQGIMETRIVVEITDEENHGFRNGDKVHVSLGAEVDTERVAREYGVKFTRTEADIEIWGLNAYGQSEAKDGEHAVVNLNDYIKMIPWTGYEGWGYGGVELDYEAIIRDHRKSISTNIAPEDMLYCSLPIYAANQAFTSKNPFHMTSSSPDCIGMGNYTDFHGEYYNGDEIKITWQIDEEKLQMLQKIMNLDFVYEDFSFTVNGLEEVREFDPFQTYELILDGGNGSGYAYGYITFQPAADRPDSSMSVDFEVISSKNGSLSNGDTIILSMKNFADNGNFMLNWGMIPTRTEIEVTVSGLN